jgi:glycosyltransferase involved in cell wall biosynthesis
MRPALAALRPSLRRWDVETAQRVTEFVSISEHVADKIRRFYGRESRVIYPPVNTDLFTADTILPLDQYLVVSALVPYKRVDLAVRAAIEGRFRLRIVGEGPEWLSLQRLSRRHDNIEMLGWLPDHELVQEYRDARAIIFPGEEDFGIVPVEAQACGRPVLALRAGGALETVVENETGLFFEQQTTEAIIDAVRRFEAREWKPAVCRANAERFHPARFRREMREVMEALVSKGSAAPAR